MRTALDAEVIPMRSKELTFREKEVLKLLANGNATKCIAALLGISPRTVEAHRRRITQKLEIKHLPGLTKYALMNELVSLEV